MSKQYIIKNTQPTLDLLDEVINHQTLSTLTTNTRDTVNWLAQYRLIKNTFDCQTCTITYNSWCLTNYAQGIDHVRWKFYIFIYL